MKNNLNQFTPRENFLMALLDKVTKQYKALLETIRHEKPFKILKIMDLSSIPGDTKFNIQITNKACVLQLSAAYIINNYNLNDFSEYHATIILKAAQGTLMDFLKNPEKEPKYKIISKQYDRNNQQYLLTIQAEGELPFIRTAEELSKDKELLLHMNVDDIYDIGHTQGMESILKEKAAMLLAKNHFK